MKQKQNDTRGGANRGQGRKKRETASRHNLLLEESTFSFFERYGKGIAGRGMDLAAATLSQNVTLSPDELLALREVVTYLYKDEKRQFEELSEPKSHIFRSIQTLEKFLK